MDSEELISMVRDRPALWNQQDKSHHNRFILEKKWDEIAQELKQSKKAARDRWKNLRDTFRKELKKHPNPTALDFKTDVEGYESSWRHFRSMLFLKDQFILFPSGEGTPGPAPPDAIYSDDDKESLKGVNSYSPSPTLPSENSLDSYFRAESPPSRPKKRRRHSTKGARPKGARGPPDADESFFRSLLPHLRKLAPDKKLLCQMRMQEVLYNFAYGESSPGALQFVDLSSSTVRDKVASTTGVVQLCSPREHDESVADNGMLSSK